MKFIAFIILIFQSFILFSQKQKTVNHAKKPAAKTSASAINEKPVLPGAFQTKEYLPLIKDKRVAIFCNHTATVGSIHLVDTLQKLGVHITKIFGPEHGFRGTADYGEKVDDYTDEKTGITIVSLYGKKRKPSAEDLADVDILMFDIQDVGVRFYTYISSLQDFMEAAMEHDKPVVILDRPNPNGFYVDGPVLDTAYRSFIGMQPVPIVYGMTMGEYAKFLIGEGLLNKQITTEWKKRQTTKSNSNSKASTPLKVIRCLNYTHKSRYTLPEKPSPNLPDQGSIYWYPSICLFEGTVLSEGRGTEKPFQIFGHPSLPNTLYPFTPKSTAGAKNPKLEGQQCYGWNLSGTDEQILKQLNGRLQLRWLLKAFALFPDKENFFIKPKKENPQPTDYFFNMLAGNSELMQQILNGKNEIEIRASWKPKLDAFKKKRAKYLLYPDF